MLLCMSSCHILSWLQTVHFNIKKTIYFNRTSHTNQVLGSHWSTSVSQTQKSALGTKLDGG